MQLRHVLGLHGDDPALGSPLEADTDSAQAKLRSEPAQRTGEIFGRLGPIGRRSDLLLDDFSELA
jgi:hypothetical protein